MNMTELYRAKLSTQEIADSEHRLVSVLLDRHKTIQDVDELTSKNVDVIVTLFYKKHPDLLIDFDCDDLYIHLNTLVYRTIYNLQEMYFREAHNRELELQYGKKT
jgi:hypothetical protein